MDCGANLDAVDRIVCPKCDKDTGLGNFCIHCGEKLDTTSVLKRSTNTHQTDEGSTVIHDDIDAIHCGGVLIEVCMRAVQYTYNHINVTIQVANYVCP